MTGCFWRGGRSRSLLRLVLLATALAFSGCTSVQLKTPTGFVALDRSEPYAYRAVSPAGVVLAARVEDSRKDQGGDLAFWAEAVTRRMRRLGGYALLEETDLKSSQGVAGKQLRFGHDEGREPYRYSITLFVDGKKLFVVEAGGSENAFAAAEKALLSATTSVH